jgi:Zn-dependent M28 family amino/carboxypeptidase
MRVFLGMLAIGLGITSSFGCRAAGGTDDGDAAGSAVVSPAQADGGAGAGAGQGDGGAAPAPPAGPGVSVFDAVDETSIKKLLSEIAGVTPVTVGGETFSITERWSPAGKTRFRSYYRQYFEGLGAQVNELAFAVEDQVGESEGHNIEAVLPGQSADTVVLIVHYDTVGIDGQEKANPGADDDGSGLAMMMEAARIFARYPNRKYTLRFVAADYEEISDLAGDDAYVAYLKGEASKGGFKIVVAADDDQTGWSCWSENKCGKNAPPKNSSFQFIACSGDEKNYDYPELIDGMKQVLAAHPIIGIDTGCDGSGDTDHYSFWKEGIPAYVVEEYASDKNPHYDDTGHDTIEKIDFDYLWTIARVNIALQAKLAGISE